MRCIITLDAGMICTMIRYFLFFAAIGTGAVAQCPEPVLGVGEFRASGANLIVPQDWAVTANGEIAVPCGEWAQQGVQSDQIDGFLPSRPTAVIDLEGMGPHILMVMAQAQCEPLLAVRTADGLWHFGEQGVERQEATIWGAPDGPLQVWVGSKGQEQCDATLTLETFDR